MRLFARHAPAGCLTGRLTGHLTTVGARLGATLATVVLLAATPPGPAHAREAPEAVHGADAVFVSPDVAVIWAVLRDAAGDHADVWLRVVDRTGKYHRLAIDSVDPFTKARTQIEPGIALARENRIRSDRASFSDLPSRELRFYLDDEDWRAGRSALDVYYLGVPDTTPEFTTRSAMDAYLDNAPLIAHPVGRKP